MVLDGYGIDGFLVLVDCIDSVVLCVFIILVEVVVYYVVGVCRLVLFVVFMLVLYVLLRFFNVEKLVLSCVWYVMVIELVEDCMDVVVDVLLLCEGGSVLVWM